MFMYLGDTFVSEILLFQPVLSQTVVCACSHVNYTSKRKVDSQGSCWLLRTGRSIAPNLTKTGIEVAGFI